MRASCRSTRLFVPCAPLQSRASRVSVSRAVPLRRRRPRAQLTGPNGLPNARDVASAAPAIIRSGKLFRGAAPAALAGPPHNCAAALLRSAHVLLDLRSNDERRNDVAAVVRLACGEGFERRLHHVGLLNKRRVVWGLGRTLDRAGVARIATRVVVSPVTARRTIVSEVDAGGLVLLNQILVEAGASQIGRALRIVAKGVSSGSVYVFCSAGKDRTGLLTALVLHTLGVSEQSIIEDYVASEQMWDDDAAVQLRVDYCERLLHAGLTPQHWVGAPPDVMEDTLRYIRRRFGGLDDYLLKCGFDETYWHLLRTAMSPSLSPSLSPQTRAQ
ncbi:hypothetical protein BWQ96_08604 [Gracilariopsis chorda]|uniref:Tyrosine-protein phosphatase n=1 Tax=Gracilariopsis chorda TaxID=448386 RepID=A0A2V3II32_9FLOR|nr:hypothetical protein BWQ96_08604 [Gracilariopsis chorda]|eukprot:PXF41683.1 hypothetical protein BWQ96_08604 [Gracilariopsis chorda]